MPMHNYKQTAMAMPLLLLLLTGLQLAACVSEPVRNDYVPLDKWLQQMDMRVCLSSTPADILFVVDGSQSVGSTNFHLLMKSALIDTISKFRIGASFTQVGVLVFSDQISQVIPIGKYSHKVQLLSEVSNLHYVDSFTSIEAALEGSAAELQRRFKELNSSHEIPANTERKTVIVFMTDGWDNHGSSFYLRDLLSQLHLQVSGVMVLGLQDSNSEMLQQLASQKMLIFNPTTYPEFQASLLNLINSHCGDSCHKYEEEMEQAQQGVSVTVRYLNTITDNYIHLLQQQRSLFEYVKQVNFSANIADQDIQRTCNKQDNDLLEQIVDAREKLERKKNQSLTIDVDSFENQMLRIVNEMQTEQFEYSRQLTIEKARRESMEVQEQQLRTEFEARLKNKVTIRQTNEGTLRALEKRIREQQQEIEKMEKTINSSRTTNELLTERLMKQETLYDNRLEDMSKLSKEYTSLLTISSGASGGSNLKKLTDDISFCQSYLRNHETVLFAIRCGSGAKFSSLFSLEESTFSQTAFTTLSSSESLYKSTFLRNMHIMGYFKDASLQFLVGSNVVATLKMDTSRFELANIFSRFHVTSSFPYVASFINSVYRSSLSQFRLRNDTEFLMIFGDLAKYLKTGQCEDLQGVFVVLNKPHRCFPNAETFPQVYIAASPYGGRMTIACSEFRVVTSQLPAHMQLPSISFTDDKFIDETLLYLRSGAGMIAPILMSDSSTPASVLLEVDEITELSRHYKNSILNQIDMSSLTQVEVEVYDANKRMVASLTFKGPFGAEEHSWQWHTGGSSHNSWSWFQAKHLESAETFGLEMLKKAKFEVYDGKQLLSIGVNMAAPCENRKYFLTIIDGQSPCQCFGKVKTPAVFFANGQMAQNCDQMQEAHSLRIVGRFPMDKVRI